MPRIDIRPARPRDSAFIYRLAMDPSVREASTRSDGFTFEEHDQWFTEKLASGLNRIWIMDVDECPVAQVRYGRIINTASAEIAISVSPQERRRGYAKELLFGTERMAGMWLHVNHLIALVLKQNEPSLRLFQNCGYVRLGEEQRMGKDHWRCEKAL